MKNIKIAHVSNIDLGSKIHLGNYMSYQRDQGYHVYVINNPGSWLSHDTTILNGVSVKIMMFEPRISPLTDLKTLWRLFNYFRQEQFDIVHTHTVKPGLLGRIAAKMAGVPIIVHTVHGFYFYEGMSAGQYRQYIRIEKLGAACCDLILSQNKHDIQTAIQWKICSSSKIHHLGNGIDLSRFDPGRVSAEKVMALRDDLRISPHHAVIGFVARWERDKGIYEFLEAASRLKADNVKAKYLLIGASPSKKRTAVTPQCLINKYGLERETIILGFRDDIPELISLMDMVVLPSHGREGIPRILMESAAMGKPVVATRVRGNVEAVDHGVTGLLVQARDEQALASGVLQLVNNPVQAAEMGRQARRKALKYFDERHFFWKTDTEYRRLLINKLGPASCSILRPVPIH